LDAEVLRGPSIAVSPIFSEKLTAMNVNAYLAVQLVKVRGCSSSLSTIDV